MQKILHDHSDEAFLPLPIAARFDNFVKAFLQEYTLLANRADRIPNLYLFSMTPKFHYLWHLGKRARFLNPRRGNTMVDEDFVGQCKDLVAACASGTEAHRVPEKFLERYNWGKHILLEYGM